MTRDVPQVEDLRRLLSDAAECDMAGTDCPDPERFWEAQQDRLHLAETRALVEHTADCPRCAEAWRLAHAMGAMEDLASRPVVSWPLRSVVAAAAVLFIFAGLWALNPGWNPLRRPPGEVVYRSGEGMEIVSLISEEKSLPRLSFRLAWSPGTSDTTYNLIVSTETFTRVYRATNLEHSECIVPPENLEGLDAGTRLLWQVQALTPEGRRITSDTFFAILE